MADKFGVLGKITTAVIGSATAYTCPVGKAAKVKLQAIFQAGANSAVTINVNGTPIVFTGAIAVNQYQYTAKGAGLFQGAVVAAYPDGTTMAKTVAPADPIYYLSAGQNISYLIATANLLSMDFTVVGTEVDSA